MGNEKIVDPMKKTSGSLPMGPLERRVRRVGEG